MVNLNITHVNDENFKTAKLLISSGFECISYIRELFDHNYYEDNIIQGFPAKKLKRNISEETEIFLDWIENGCFEALKKRYLRKIIFGIFLDSKEPTEMIEIYKINIKYNDLEKNNTQLKVEDLVKTLKYICVFTQLLNPLPEIKYGSMKLEYYDDKTPKSYEPPMFEAAKNLNYNISKNGTNIIKLNLGSFNTSKISLSFSAEISNSLINFTNTNEFVKLPKHNQKDNLIKENLEKLDNYRDIVDLNNLSNISTKEIINEKFSMPVRESNSEIYSVKSKNTGLATPINLGENLPLLSPIFELNYDSRHIDYNSPENPCSGDIKKATRSNIEMLNLGNYLQNRWGDKKINYYDQNYLYPNTEIINSKNNMTKDENLEIPSKMVKRQKKLSERKLNFSKIDEGLKLDVFKTNFNEKVNNNENNSLEGIDQLKKEDNNNLRYQKLNLQIENYKIPENTDKKDNQKLESSEEIKPYINNFTNFKENNSQNNLEIVNCFCHRPKSQDLDMIHCESCNFWLHAVCCGFIDIKSLNKSSFCCIRCIPGWDERKIKKSLTLAKKRQVLEYLLVCNEPKDLNEIYRETLIPPKELRIILNLSIGKLIFKNIKLNNRKSFYTINKNIEAYKKITKFMFPYDLKIYKKDFEEIS